MTRMAAVTAFAQVSLVQSYRMMNNQNASLCKPNSERVIPKVPKNALEYNGISWPEYCFEGDEPEHMFLLGDWGGLDYGGRVKPAVNVKKEHGPSRWFKRGIDDRAQVLVARQMSKLADKVKPKFVLNGGDNFYWGGIIGRCGKPIQQAVDDFSDPNAKETLQFKHVFEDMYTGETLDTVPFLGCFGNHDYGGFTFGTAWDQQIAYTWGPTKRWILPGQYWHQHVEYPKKDMSVDVYMIDTNYQDTTHPWSDPGHNICSHMHNHGTNCGSVAPGAPRNPNECVRWFTKLWKDQQAWMEKKICESTADWQIVVTHFPPEHFSHRNTVGDWRRIGYKCGIDFFVGSHRHDQEMHPGGGWSKIPYVVAGGGGGITSERIPGRNAQYGFFDMIITKDKLFVESINQDGWSMGKMTVHKRESAAMHHKREAASKKAREAAREAAQEAASSSEAALLDESVTEFDGRTSDAMPDDGEMDEEDETNHHDDDDEEDQASLS